MSVWANGVSLVLFLIIYFRCGMPCGSCCSFMINTNYEMNPNSCKSMTDQRISAMTKTRHHGNITTKPKHHGTKKKTNMNFLEYGQQTLNHLYQHWRKLRGVEAVAMRQHLREKLCSRFKAQIFDSLDNFRFGLMIRILPFIRSQSNSNFQLPCLLYRISDFACRGRMVCHRFSVAEPQSWLVSGMVG